MTKMMVSTNKVQAMAMVSRRISQVEITGNYLKSNFEISK
jgi:hypothetical protein